MDFNDRGVVHSSYVYRQSSSCAAATMCHITCRMFNSTFLLAEEKEKHFFMAYVGKSTLITLLTARRCCFVT